MLHKDNEITKIPLLTVREILKREGVNDPKIEANILLQDKTSMITWMSFFDSLIRLLFLLIVGFLHLEKSF